MSFIILWYGQNAGIYSCPVTSKRHPSQLKTKIYQKCGYAKDFYIQNTCKIISTYLNLKCSG